MWNHTIGRAIRFWSADGGRDQRALDALAAGRLENVAVEAPSDRSEHIAQLLLERNVARQNLVTVTESFRYRDWRRDHHGGGVHPETHLWSAAAAFLELDDALDRPGH